jgi:alanine racemase
MTRPTVATVHLEAVQHNFRQIRALVLSCSGAPVHEHQSTRAPSVIAVVKANAYGHGASAVALALEAAGASMFACADLEEGVSLREAGVKAPILVFGALSVSDLSHLFSHRLTPTVSTPSAARALEAAAASRDVVLGCH